MPDSTHAFVLPDVLVGIYQITGPDRVYVGSSDNIPRRWHQHRAQLRGNRHHNYRLQAAWNKHGEAAFGWAVIEEVAVVADLPEHEQRQLDAALIAGPVYNLALDVVTPARGLVHTAESRAKMSASIRASMTPEKLAAQSKRVRGENNPGGKLTDAIVVDICQRLMASGHPAEIAAEFEVTESTVYQIRRGQIWSHIVTPATVATMMSIRQNVWAKRQVTEADRVRMRAVGQANKGRPCSELAKVKTSERARGEGNPKAKLTEAKVAQIKRLLAEGVRVPDLAPMFEVTLNSIYRIKTGESWAHVEPEPTPESGTLF